nr:MAG TPA: hypothetical protein [Caudoviricetes sp.]
MFHFFTLLKQLFYVLFRAFKIYLGFFRFFDFLRFVCQITPSPSAVVSLPFLATLQYVHGEPPISRSQFLYFLKFP